MCILKAMRNEVPKVNNLQRTTCRSSSCDEEPEKKTIPAPMQGSPVRGEQVPNRAPIKDRGEDQALLETGKGMIKYSQH
jgi:hypothetical protein